jgi:hypothetical protein
MNQLKTTLENREFGHTARSATSRFSFAGSSFLTKLNQTSVQFILRRMCNSNYIPSLRSFMCTV